MLWPENTKKRRWCNEIQIYVLRNKKIIEAKTLEDAYDQANDWAGKLPEMQWDDDLFPGPQRYHGGWCGNDKELTWQGQQIWD